MKHDWSTTLEAFNEELQREYHALSTKRTCRRTCQVASLFVVPSWEDEPADTDKQPGPSGRFHETSLGPEEGGSPGALGDRRRTVLGTRNGTAGVLALLLSPGTIQSLQGALDSDDKGLEEGRGGVCPSKGDMSTEAEEECSAESWTGGMMVGPRSRTAVPTPCPLLPGDRPLASSSGLRPEELLPLRDSSFEEFNKTIVSAWQALAPTPRTPPTQNMECERQPICGCNGSQGNDGQCCGAEDGCCTDPEGNTQNKWCSPGHGIGHEDCCKEPAAIAHCRQVQPLTGNQPGPICSPVFIPLEEDDDDWFSGEDTWHDLGLSSEGDRLRRCVTVCSDRTMSSLFRP